MNITVSVLGRTTADQTFTELTSSTIALTSEPVACTPAAPPAAVGQELQLRVVSDDDVTVTLGQWLDPATRPAPTPIKDTQGNVIGTEPAPEPYVRNCYVAWGKAPRQIPFNAGNSIVLARPGAAATV